MSVREKIKANNSLICLLQALEGRVTVVELHNESIAKGFIKHVDGFMNINMTTVEFTSPNGQTSYLENFFVQGPQIRYVQIPDDVNVLESMRQQIGQAGFGPVERGRGSRGRGRRRQMLEPRSRTYQQPKAE